MPDADEGSRVGHVYSQYVRQCQVSGDKLWPRENQKFLLLKTKTVTETFFSIKQQTLCLFSPLQKAVIGLCVLHFFPGKGPVNLSWRKN